MSEENEMTDAQFGKIFAAMIGGLAALTIILIFLAYLVVGTSTNAESEIRLEQRAAEVASRIAPIGKIKVGEPVKVAAAATAAPAGADAETATGESIYSANCAACHAAGVAGAPKIGDAAAWKERLGQGTDTLYTHAIQGFQGKAGYMPPKGGNAALSDEAVKAAVDHMVQNSQ